MKAPTQKTLITFWALFCVFTFQMRGQTNSGWCWVPDAHERSLGLPPGIPRTVDTNGNVEYFESDHYTTQAYHDEAARLMLSEANYAAQALHLENGPMTSANAAIDPVPFGFFYQDGLMGNVFSTNYTYGFMEAGMLNRIEIANFSEVQQSLQDQLLPENQVDDQAAYQLATQWLSSFSVDVKGLNRDCQLSVASSPVFNYVGNGKEPIRRMFSPTYDVAWKSSNSPTPGPAAYVQLYLPDKLLISLGVEDPKYNLRPPLIFTNLAALFPGNAITTNYPTTPIMVYPSGPSFSEVTFITDSNQPEPKFHDVPLTHWIETQTHLNTNHVSLSQLMTLKPISGPDEWGRVAFELPIPFEALRNNATVNLGRLDTNGNFTEVTVEGTDKAADGNTLLSWNINYDSPRWNQLRARLIYFHGMDGDQFNLIGPPLSYFSRNTCRLYESTSLFIDDRANLYAELREHNAKFHVKITSLQGHLINDISSSTTNGLINLMWDLTGRDGQKYTSNSFIGYFYVTYPDDAGTNPPVKGHFTKIGTSGD